MSGEIAILKQKIKDLEVEIDLLRKEKSEALTAFHEARNDYNKLKDKINATNP